MVTVRLLDFGASLVCVYRRTFGIIVGVMDTKLLQAKLCTENVSRTFLVCTWLFLFFTTSNQIQERCYFYHFGFLFVCIHIPTSKSIT